MGIWWWSGWWFGTWILWLSIYWEWHHPNWRTHIFQRGRYTTNQSWLASGKRTFAVCELENFLWPLKLWQSVKLPEGNDVDDSKNKGVFFLSKFEENRIRIHKLGMSINQPVLQGRRHRGLEQSALFKWLTVSNIYLAFYNKLCPWIRAQRLCRFEEFPTFNGEPISVFKTARHGYHGWWGWPIYGGETVPLKIAERFHHGQKSNPWELKIEIDHPCLANLCWLMFFWEVLPLYIGDDQNPWTWITK
jgi:hypothetical protein